MKNIVIIIGAGPAGTAAAIQLKRSGIEPLLFDIKPSGSLLKNAWSVENYLDPGSGISGRQLLKEFHAMLTKHHLRPIYHVVEQLDYRRDAFEIKADNNKTYYSDYVMVASGTKPKILPDKITRYIKAQIFSEVLPLLNKRGKTVVIIGGGDAAFDNALNLATHNQVIVCNRRQDSQALPSLISKALKHKNIRYYKSCCLQAISLDEHGKLNVSFAYGQKPLNITADYLLQAIGRLPQKDFYTVQLRACERGLIKQGRLFLIGDVRNNRYRQVAIAVSDGIIAAMKIFHNLQKNNVRSCQ